MGAGTAAAAAAATHRREFFNHHLLEGVEAALAQHDEAHEVRGVVPAVEPEQLLPDVHAFLRGVLVESLVERARKHFARGRGFCEGAPKKAIRDKLRRQLDE